jgi:hypothetical protein
VPLVKALQELNDSLEKVTSKQQQELELLRARLDQIESMLSLKGNTDVSNAAERPKGVLEQNIPNPFYGTTTIKYNLPQQFSSASMNIYSSAGALMKSIPIKNPGVGSITLTKGTLTAGLYQYSLIADGKIIDAKQMILAK